LVLGSPIREVNVDDAAAPLVPSGVAVDELRALALAVAVRAAGHVSITE
jgi:hypothetical protein